MSRRRVPPSKPVACPICGRPLKWTSDRWLATFDCEVCGQFSDFGGSALSAAPPHAEAAPPGSDPATTTSDDEEPD